MIDLCHALKTIHTNNCNRYRSFWASVDLRRLARNEQIKKYINEMTSVSDNVLKTVAKIAESRGVNLPGFTNGKFDAGTVMHYTGPFVRTDAGKRRNSDIQINGPVQNSKRSRRASVE